MNGKAWGVVCIAVGLSTAYAGFRLVQSQEHPPGTTGFEGPWINRRGLLMLAGYSLLGVGLILAVIFSSFFFIGG